MQVPSDTFSIRLEPSNGVVHLHLSGRFDLAAVRAFDGVFAHTHALDVVVDLEEVTFMDGAAWLAVMDLEHRALDGGKEVRLVNVPQPLRRIFDLTATGYLLSDADRNIDMTPGRRTAVMR
jgi:anti-anti-sigma factor